MSYLLFLKKAAGFGIVVCCKLKVALYEIIWSGTRGIGPYRIMRKNAHAYLLYGTGGL